MAHVNKVVRSINAPGDGRCVDLFQRPDGSFGFEEFRRDPEDGSGWYPVGGFGAARFDDQVSCLTGARDAVPWLDMVTP
jgi:hypothetical protein